jgi:hypothetical protein
LRQHTDARKLTSFKVSTPRSSGHGCGISHNPVWDMRYGRAVADLLEELGGAQNLEASGFFRVANSEPLPTQEASIMNRPST